MSRKKVLVVDDNPINVQILEEIFSGEYLVRCAAAGPEAIRVASLFRPAIVLLDVMLPGIDGISVCRRLRQLPGGEDLVIIMVSAKAMPSEKAAGLDAGADDYITKPFDETELVEVLRRYDKPDRWEPAATESGPPDGTEIVARF